MARKSKTTRKGRVTRRRPAIKRAIPALVRPVVKLRGSTFRKDVDLSASAKRAAASGVTLTRRKKPVRFVTSSSRPGNSASFKVVPQFAPKERLVSSIASALSSIKNPNRPRGANEGEDEALVRRYRASQTTGVNPKMTLDAFRARHGPDSDRDLAALWFPAGDASKIDREMKRTELLRGLPTFQSGSGRKRHKKRVKVGRHKRRR